MYIEQGKRVFLFAKKKKKPKRSHNKKWRVLIFSVLGFSNVEHEQSVCTYNNGQGVREKRFFISLSFFDSVPYRWEKRFSFCGGNTNEFRRWYVQKKSIFFFVIFFVLMFSCTAAEYGHDDTFVVTFFFFAARAIKRIIIIIIYYERLYDVYGRFSLILLYYCARRGRMETMHPDLELVFDEELTTYFSP